MTDVTFGPYRLKRQERTVEGPAGMLDLSARAFDILCVLLDKPGEVIGKDELFAAAWPGVVVEENTLQVHVSALRKVLPPDMIATVHGRGYKYTGPAPKPLDTPGQSTSASAARKPVIAVLPFDNLSGDPGQQYFSDGVTGDITDRLTRFPLLAVIGQHSASAFRGSAPDFATIRAQLKADFVVTGNIRRSDDRIRVAARLTDAASETAVWAERYDRPLNDIFDLQDELTSLIVAAIAKQLDIEIGRRGDGERPANFAAYESILKGNWHFNQLTRAANQEALGWYTRALELEPRSAEALGSLALCYSSKWLFDLDLAANERAIALAGEGMGIDPANSLCHAVRGLGLVWAKGREAGRALLDRAVALNPSGWLGPTNRSMLSTYDGKPEEARQYCALSKKLDPYPPAWHYEFQCISYFQEERFAEVLPGVEPITDGQWDMMYALACYGHLGRRDEARGTLARFRSEAREPDWLAAAEREPYADCAVRNLMVEGIRKALAF